MTRVIRRLILLMAPIVAGWPMQVPAQHYRLRLDANAQSAAFRRLVPDSILATRVVASPNGGLQTPDGYAVRCLGNDYCLFMRTGDALRAVPVSTTVNLAAWGFGVEGLSLQATGRVIADAGRDRVWPGTSPTGQLLEGYVEYQRGVIVARAGRQLLSSRLEPLGFDGATVKSRWDRASMEFTAYAGWGLAQASALGVTNPLLNPLDEWRPRDRQTVAGAEVQYRGERIDVRTEYRREIDPRDHYFVSERATVSLGARLANLRLIGGADLDLLDNSPGSADLTATYMQPRFSVSAGVRRYQPYFNLWTLWGAFNPVAYHAVNATAELRPRSWLTVHASGELYAYEDAEISTGVVPDLTNRGRRLSSGATVTIGNAVTIDGHYDLERGPGAAGQYGDIAVSYAPSDQYALSVYGGTMARPLELRYFDATARWIGTRADWRLSSHHRMWGDLAFMRDARDRPDAAATSLAQVRARAGVSVTFGSRADRLALPKARRMTP
ncbi:hypothetical protein [Gemmatimonas aurantiaca]|uniref:hypothetical protein n=1 Tax=Gemmatimonas aurantiaca TaxID=173480 RepID=UPI00301E3D03